MTVRALWATCEGLGDGPGDSEAGLTRFLARNSGLSQVVLEDGAIVGAVLCGHDGRRGFWEGVGGNLREKLVLYSIGLAG